MGLLDNIIEEKGQNEGFFPEPAEPVKEILPRRNSPYINEDSSNGTNDDEYDEYSNFGMPQQAITPNLSDSEIEIMADLETNILMLKIHTFVNVGKGFISEFVVNEEDYEVLRQYKLNPSVKSDEEIKTILDRVALKEKLLNYKSENTSTIKELLHKVIKNDLIEQRKNGKLKFPSKNEFLLRMVMNQLTELTGDNVQLVSTVGINIFKKVKSFL
ncbi:hypothetical protein GOQ04_14845 [Emticicia sp. ODNR4P]|nr:hypothetical protein [Emticicia sp. ODNR4P]